jgi:hypothetical protein
VTSSPDSRTSGFCRATRTVWWNGRLFPGERPITGSVADIADQLHQIAELGYDHIQVSLTPRTQDRLEIFALVLEALNA